MSLLILLKIVITAVQMANGHHWRLRRPRAGSKLDFCPSVNWPVSELFPYDQPRIDARNKPAKQLMPDFSQSYGLFIFVPIMETKLQSNTDDCFLEIWPFRHIYLA